MQKQTATFNEFKAYPSYFRQKLDILAVLKLLVKVDVFTFCIEQVTLGLTRISNVHDSYKQILFGPLLKLSSSRFFTIYASKLS